MLDSGEAAKNREIQPEAAFDLTSNPGSEWVNSNPRMQIALFSTSSLACAYWVDFAFYSLYKMFVFSVLRSYQAR